MSLNDHALLMRLGSNYSLILLILELVLCVSLCTDSTHRK